MRVVEYGSVALASENLDTSKSTISKAIKQLEDLIKAPLFFRKNQSLYLTDEGESFYKACLCMEDDLMNLNHLSLKLAGSSPEKFIICISPTLLNVELQNKIENFRKKYNLKVKIIVDSQDVTPRNFYNIDVFITREWKDLPQRIKHVKVSDEKLIFCASTEYIKQFGCPKKTEDLISHAVITHLRPDAITGLLMEISTKLNYEQSQMIKVNSTIGIKEVMMANLGIAMLPEYIVREEILNRTVVPLFSHLTQQHTFYLYYQVHDGVASDIVASFLNEIA